MMDNFVMSYNKCIKCPHATVCTEGTENGIIILCGISGESLRVEECPFK